MNFPRQGAPDRPPMDPAASAPAPRTPLVDLRRPRECWQQAFTGTPGPCPRCGAVLVQSNQTYLVTTRSGAQTTDSFLLGSDCGWFCPRCPTLLLNMEEVGDRLRGIPTALRWDTGSRFAVLGIVDLDAVPADKRDVPLGEDGNPVPLIRFSRVVPQGGAGRAGATSRAKAPTGAGPARRRRSKGKRRRSR